METVGTTAFIGLVVIALTQQIKFLSSAVTGIVTAIVAVAVGALIGILDTSIGLPDITVASAVWTAIMAIGAHTLASATTTKNS